jgi:hypothetical protein
MTILTTKKALGPPEWGFITWLVTRSYKNISIFLKRRVAGLVERSAYSFKRMEQATYGLINCIISAVYFQENLT